MTNLSHKLKSSYGHINRSSTQQFNKINFRSNKYDFFNQKRGNYRQKTTLLERLFGRSSFFFSSQLIGK